MSAGLHVSKFSARLWLLYSIFGMSDDQLVVLTEMWFFGLDTSVDQLVVPEYQSLYMQEYRLLSSFNAALVVVLILSESVGFMDFLFEVRCSHTSSVLTWLAVNPV